MYDPLTILQTARVNRPYRNALEADAQYVQAAATREKAHEAQLALPAVHWPTSPLNADVALDDWLERVADARAAEQARETKLTALRGLLHDCDGQIVGRALVDPNRLLRSLAADFDALMAELKSVVDRLGGAKSAAEAVDVGDDAVDAWRGLAPLRSRYDELRAAQNFVFQHEHELLQNSRSRYIDERHVNPDPLASDLAVRNLDEVFPEWRQPDTRVTLVGESPNRRPWPEDPVAQLVWMVTSEAQPWLPTIGQVKELHAERHRRLNPPPKTQRLSEFPKQQVRGTKSIFG